MKKSIIFIVFILADQISKIIVQKNLIGNFTQDYTCNPFIAWSIPLNGFIFWFIWIFAIFFLIYLIQTSKKNIFLIIALAGAISNFIDRIRLSCVIDFIQVSNFPTFNLADAFITVGLVIFVLQNFKNEESKN